jgi:serine/threonine protein phosphatase PrpC
MTTPPSADGAPGPPPETDLAEHSSPNGPGSERAKTDGTRAEQEVGTDESLEAQAAAGVSSSPPTSPNIWRHTPTLTVAPTIGTVLPMPPPRLAAMTAHRPASVSLDGLFIGPYHVAAGSLVGSAHLASGVPRQDAYDFIEAEAGRLVVAVADGMGSRPNSQVGARAFCDGMCLAVGASPNDSAASYLASANDYAVKVCRDHDLAPDDIAYVAALAVFHEDACEVLRVGDVSAFALTDEGFTELFADQEGHVNIVAAALPAEPLPTPESFCGHGLTRVVLCTDGLANDIRHSAQVRAWLQTSWTALVDVYGMAEALRFRRRGSHDDRTAVLVSVRTPEDIGVVNDGITGASFAG